jgi:flagellar biosynthesis/type III secretory pathway chaperone
MFTVSTTWEYIIDALRNEMQEYGALLGLFEDQQANLLRRDATAVITITASIEEQVRTTQRCRDLREQALSQFAIEHERPATSSLRQLLPFFTPEVRPMLEAILTEINHLIHRLRRRARHNQMMLSRSVEAYEEAIRTLRPEIFAKTYSARGALSSRSAYPGWRAAG